MLFAGEEDSIFLLGLFPETSVMVCKSLAKLDGLLSYIFYWAVRISKSDSCGPTSNLGLQTADSKRLCSAEELLSEEEMRKRADMY